MIPLIWALFGIGSAEWLVDAQLVGNQLSSFTLDDLGTTTQQNQWLYSRSIVGYSGASGRLQYRLQVEGVNFQVAGDNSDLGLSVSSDIFRNSKQSRKGVWILPRDFSVATQLGDWGIQAGIQSFDWGLGILSNSGMQETRFGVNQQGNIYARLAVSQALNDVRLFIAADAIVRDENAMWSSGDRAYQSIIGTQYIKDSFQLGLLSGVRYQQDREEYANPYGETDSFVVPLDIFSTYQITESWSLASELVGVVGSSNRLVNESTKGNYANVRYFGGVVRAQNEQESFVGDVQTLLELGSTSGDANSGNDVVGNFSFHSDYNVGLILYDEVLPRLQARSVERLADPDLSGTPAPSLRYAVSQGGVNNSTYLQLCSSLHHKDWLVRLAWLEAISSVPIADAYQTALAGGYSTNSMGEDTTHRLGSEVDIRLQYTWNDTIFIGTDAGYFMPGSALPTVEPTTKVMGYLRVATGGQR